MSRRRPVRDSGTRAVGTNSGAQRIRQVVSLWGHQLDAVESQDSQVDTEIDWVIKRKLFQRYQDRMT